MSTHDNEQRGAKSRNAHDDERAERIAYHLSRMVLVPPIRLLEYSELEPNVVSILNVGGQVALRVPRQPEVLDTLQLMVDAVNEVASPDLGSVKEGE
jgi:hypothetical protein